MKSTVLIIPLETKEETPDFTIAAPINPPIKACEELVGSPKYQVIIFQIEAPSKAAKTIDESIIFILTIPLPMVFAT